MKLAGLIIITLTIVCRNPLFAQYQDKFDIHFNGGASFIFAGMEGAEENGIYFSMGAGYTLLNQVKLESNVCYSTYSRMLNLPVPQYINSFEPYSNNIDYENLKLIDANLLLKLYMNNHQFPVSPFLLFGLGKSFVLTKDVNDNSGFSIRIGLGSEFNVSKSFLLFIQSQFIMTYFNNSQFNYIPVTFGISHYF